MAASFCADDCKLLGHRPRTVYPCCQTFAQRRAASESAWDPRAPYPQGPPKPAGAAKNVEDVSRDEKNSSTQKKETKDKKRNGGKTAASSAAPSLSGSNLPKPRLDFKMISRYIHATSLFRFRYFPSKPLQLDGMLLAPHRGPGKRIIRQLQSQLH